MIFRYTPVEEFQESDILIVFVIHEDTFLKIKGEDCNLNLYVILPISGENIYIFIIMINLYS